MLRCSAVLTFVSSIAIVMGCNREGAQPPNRAVESKAATAVGDTLASERQRLQGDWVSVSVEVDGEADNSRAGIGLSFSGDKVVMGPSGEGRQEGYRQEGSFVLRPSKDPKEIDMTMPGEGGKSWVLRGVYEVTDDELRVCIGQVGGVVDKKTGKALTDPESERPPHLDSKAGMLLTLKRAKK